MTTPHKHAALIKAWADGAKIQVRWPEEWDNSWKDIDNPIWNTENPIEYRIKPKTIRYRVALWKPQYSIDKIVPIIVTSEENKEEPREQWKGFVRWLTDWVEVEI